MVDLPVCRKCIHFFITYETATPYGCRAMNFKSKIVPSRVVYNSSGIFCQLYSPKEPESGGKGGRGLVA